MKQDHFFYQRYHGQKNARGLTQKDRQRGLKTVVVSENIGIGEDCLKINIDKKSRAIRDGRLKMKGDCWFSKRWIHDYIPP